MRKLNIGVSGGYSSIASLSHNICNYKGATGGTGLTYQLTKAVHAVARYDYRHYDVDGFAFKRNTYRASIGLAFSPGEVPLALW